MACECEGPCVCAELDAMLEDIGNANVGQTSYLHNDQFDVGIGRNLLDGERIVNLFLHESGPYDDADPSMLAISFGRAEAGRLIHLLMRAYHANWSVQDE